MNELELPPTETFAALPPDHRFQSGKPRWMVCVYCAACDGKDGRTEIARVPAPPLDMPDDWQPAFVMVRVTGRDGEIDHERTAAFMCRRHGPLDSDEARRLAIPAVWKFLDTGKTQHVRVSTIRD